MTSYNPIFLLQNQLVLSKLGCLQKTRAQNIDIWPNGGHFCLTKYDFLKIVNCPKISQFFIFGPDFLHMGLKLCGNELVFPSSPSIRPLTLILRGGQNLPPPVAATESEPRGW